MEYLTLILLIAAVIIAIIYISKSSNTTDPINKVQELKRAYDKALIEGNKRTALDAGRAYYNALRENKGLTVYDEQAIANDLSTMIIQQTNNQHTTSSQS